MKTQDGGDYVQLKEFCTQTGLDREEFNQKITRVFKDG